MYMGLAMEAMPTPIPPMILKITKKLRSIGMEVPMDETMKRVAAIKRLVLLPKRSQSMPAQEAPSTHPSKTQLAAHPVCAGERWKNFSMKPMAPEMTAVSYPKSSPPIAATQVTRIMKGVLPSEVPVLEIVIEVGSGGMFMGFM